MDYVEVIKIFGPQAIPWIALGYLGKWHLDRLDRDTENRLKLALSIEEIAKVVEKIYDRLTNVKTN